MFNGFRAKITATIVASGATLENLENGVNGKPKLADQVLNSAKKLEFEVEQVEKLSAKGDLRGALSAAHQAMSEADLLIRIADAGRSQEQPKKRIGN